MNKILYHGSPSQGLKLLDPHNKSIRNESEGPVVFATDSFPFSLVFMSPRANDDWTKKGIINNEGEIVHYYLIADEKRFRENDHGGSVYEVSKDDFRQEQFGMKTEWISKKSVSIIKEHVFLSTLDALLENNVKVCFVNKEEFLEIQQDKSYESLYKLVLS